MSLCRCVGSRLLLQVPLRLRVPGPRAALHVSSPRGDSRVQQLQRMLAKHRKKHWFQSRFKPEVFQGSLDSGPNWLGGTSLGPRKRARGEDSLRSRTVKITPDFSACRVYWRGLGSTEQDEGTAQTLQRYAKRLRHLLISYQLIGNVPPIVFVRDKEYAAVAEVEHLLACIGVHGGEELELEAPVDPVIAGDPATAGPGDQAEAWGPPLPADVFGVDRAAMLRQIAGYKKRERPSAVAEPVGDEWDRLQRQQLRRLKQKMQAKKKERREDDDDVTPAAYLAQRLQRDEAMRRRQQAEWHSDELEDGDDSDYHGVKDR
ncbi:putative ribosome-binding factor A, mitochondrial isoform X2 [Lethenteron reissneri]|uniref:putative ribosome-binding factor A, mitochondrial isoform X2 n=1 Tax=Lethenteron reissneri TaxID=7753 RepID=UPI002AB6D3D8|nr:putative ribosome-binding factor A, mitochondrial isoform X2 [Lethenteron reissneri]